MTTREPLVLLVHRVPFPPNKGDKIRSYHLLQFLAARYRVHLGTFADDPADLQHAEALRAWCEEIHIERLGPIASRARMLGALARNEPLSIASYRSAAMRRWLRKTVAATGARHFVAFSAAMAQYADELPAGAHRLLDMVDVDSDKWRQYGERRSGPIGWIYRREAKCLLRWERAQAAEHDAVTFVSAAEADLFRQRAPESADHVHAISNGVDCDYFDPAARYASPYAEEVRPLVFTGAMDYWPNVDAVGWFAEAVLPRIRARYPQAVFHIVGARPTAAVRELSRHAGVEVIGRTPDMRPWLAHAQQVVAPLRVARGIQNKVLEGFAMARPVLATSMALEGLELEHEYPLQADAAEALAALACDLLEHGDRNDTGRRMRAWVKDRYDWERRLQPLAGMMEPDSHDPGQQPTGQQPTGQLASG